MKNNYPNPLDEFRSYSYHFIMTVASSTEAHRKMLEHDQSGQVSFLEQINRVNLGEKINIPNEKAFLLVDTRRFSQYTIDSFEASHVYGTSKNPANPSVPSGIHTMKLTDSTGLSFFNFLMRIMKDELQSRVASSFFMLAIVFVGHTHDGTTKQVATCFIPVIMIDMSFEFTSKGSVYEIQFVETEGNPGERLPQMVDMGGITTLSTERKENTIGGLIQALEDSLNISSLQFYNKYTNKAFSKMSQEQRSKTEQAGKLVQYMITIPKEWSNFKVNTAGKSKNIEQIFEAKKKDNKARIDAEYQRERAAAKANKDEKESKKERTAAEAKARDSYLSFSNNIGIQDAISTILQSSKEMLDLAGTEKRMNGDAVVHRTICNVTSDINTYLVHIDIYPLYMPKLEEKNNEKATHVKKNRKTYVGGELGNVIKYDYIFTGKNSHILDLKIQYGPNAVMGLDTDLNIGQKRFAENSAQGAKARDVKEIENGLKKTEDFNPLLRTGEPIFPPISTKDERQNYSTVQTEEMGSQEALANIKAKQEYHSTLASLHFLGSIQADVTIRGNPNLIRKHADRNIRGGIPKHPSGLLSTSTKSGLVGAGTDMQQVKTFYQKEFSSKLGTEKQIYFDNYVKPRMINELVSHTQKTLDPLLDGDDIATSMIFVKLNIRAPNVDYMGNIADYNNLFTDKFFYDGFYSMMTATHTFEGGTFKHTMQLIPYDIDGSYSNNKPT